MEAQTPSPKKKKPNSPKAPGISLRTAVSEVAKLYQRYSHGSFSRGEMASALGMSAGSGAFMGKSAALKEYGLVEESAGSSKVTDLFKAIYAAPVGSAELKRNALQAVSRPSVFAGLLQQFSTKIPDEAALALRLETAAGFNRDRSLAVAAALRTSLADYGLIDASGNVLPVRDSGTAPDAAERIEADGTEETLAAPVAPGLFRVEVPLASGRRAVLALPEDVSTPDIKKICAVLAAYTSDAA